MACKKCEKKKELYYIMNPRCGWCTKSDPVVKELIKDGHTITTLDVQNEEDREKANTIKEKYDVQCGTPFFIDASNGNSVCGFREKEILEKWANGEKIPAPPKRSPDKNPNNPQQPPTQLMKFEYIWLDGGKTKRIRSKVRYLEINTSMLQSPDHLIKMAPEWSFDGSSTNQINDNVSDRILKPVKIVASTIERARTPSWIVLCEVYDHEGNPDASNTRWKLLESIKNSNKPMEGIDTQFAIEQEYVIFDSTNHKPLGWDQYGSEPPPQGNYYCGTGSDVAQGRDLAESHAMACNNAGIVLYGTNAEVMLSQWEYQTIPKNAIEASDDLWISRFILQRLAERMNLYVSYDPKPVRGEWNGSGAHINFSTKEMRENGNMVMMNLMCANLKSTHEDALKVYGVGNDMRLTGEHETSSLAEFTWGEMDRSCSIRIPIQTVTNNGKGYLEDRRPSSNMDPYEALNYILNSVANITEEVLELV
jgi:glutamine synthetase